MINCYNFAEQINFKPAIPLSLISKEKKEKHAISNDSLDTTRTVNMLEPIEKIIKHPEEQKKVTPTITEQTSISNLSLLESKGKLEKHTNSTPSSISPKLPKTIASTLSKTVTSLISSTTTATSLDSTTLYSNGISIKKPQMNSYTEIYSR